MTRRYQTSGNFELKLPMAVIESCWLMSANSELCLTAFSSESVRLNIFLQKSKEHVKLFFSATENLPYFEVASDQYKCSIEAVVEDNGDGCTARSSYGDSYRMEATMLPGPGSKALEDRYVRGKNRDNDRVRPERSAKDTDLPVQDVNLEQIKEECDEGRTAEDPSGIDALQFANQLDALKTEQATTNDGVPNLMENNNYDTDSDTISLMQDDIGDERREVGDSFPRGLALAPKNKHLAPPRPKPRGPRYSKQGACPYCGVYYGNLAQHVFSYCSKNPERIRAFHCCYCKLKVRSKEELIEHKRSHVLARDFKCEICDAGFFTRQRLIRHMRYVHLVGNNPVKIYTCTVCEKRFHYRSHYERHITIHQEEKSVQCELCGKLFKNKHNVRNHQTRMHPLKVVVTDFPYYCEKCGEGFLHLGSHRCVEAQRPRLKFSRHSSAINFQGILSDLPSEDMNSTEDGYNQPLADSIQSLLP